MNILITLKHNKFRGHPHQNHQVILKINEIDDTIYSEKILFYFILFYFISFNLI